MKHFFSIIVSCCNVEPFVRECLDSVLNQPFSSWECLIGVETSEDRTEEIVREYTIKDDRFKMFVGPRSGSCSASRNKGIDMALGEYIIFLDGDDWIAEGSLQRLHELISKRPDADIYYAAIQVHNESNKNQPSKVDTWDNYANVSIEMTGTEAILFHKKNNLGLYPTLMMQMTIFKRAFLILNGLKCIHGLRSQDTEFSTRAIFLARRIIPLHEPFYHYRIRKDSIVQQAKNSYDSLYYDLAKIIHSLLEFYAKESESVSFDKRVAATWGQSWIGRITFEWFFPTHINSISRHRRLETLRILFSDGFNAFDNLRQSSSFTTRLKGWWIKVFVKYSFLRRLSELFFIIYFHVIQLFK